MDSIAQIGYPGFLEVGLDLVVVCGGERGGRGGEGDRRGRRVGGKREGGRGRGREEGKEGGRYKKLSR